MGGGNTKCIHNVFNKIISSENLFLAWREFRRGKRKKYEIQQFEFYLEDNIFELQRILEERKYIPGKYISFCVRDPKLRNIHKAFVRDRLVHHVLFRILYPIFDKRQIFNSYSCRLEKGTHKGVLKLEEFARKLSINYKKPIYALKCDIKKFFHSIDHDILLRLIKSGGIDIETIRLSHKIIKSFEMESGKGLPLGNVTSQLFANIYLNELDQFIKHTLKEKFYLRYCDDFIILGSNKNYLTGLIPQINNFLLKELKLSMHPNKVIVRKFRQGIDFLGYVSLPHYRVLRIKTKKRVIRKIKMNLRKLESGQITGENFYQMIQSYLGILKHCKGDDIKKQIYDIIKDIELCNTKQKMKNRHCK